MTLRSLSALLLAVLPAALLATGCDSGLQGRLDERRDARFEAAKNAVAEVESKRYAALAGSVPTAEPAADVKEHALDAWRRQVAARDDQKVLQALAANAAVTDELRTGALASLSPELQVGALGTPSLYAADLGAQFLKESNDFWSKGQASSLSRYTDFLRSYLRNIETARADAEKAQKAFVAPPFIDEANFDLAFVHALNYLNLSRVGERSALFPSNANDYQVAFGVAMRTASEGFSDYISRLCALNDGLRARCTGIPHEFRPAVVDRAFLEWLLERINGFKATTEAGAVFADVLKPIGESLAKAIETPIVAVEDPVLPPTVAPVGGINGVRVVLSPNSGLKVHDTVIAESFSGSLPGSLKGDVGKTFDLIKATPGGGVDYQRAALELPTDLGASQWVQIIRSFPNELVKEVFFVARRRIDDSMRRTAVNMKMPRVDDSDTASYQFKEDGARTSCALVGTLGDAPFGKKKDFYAEVTPSGVRLAELLPAEDPKDRVLGDTTKFPAINVAAAAEAAAEPDLGKFLADNPGIRLRVFLKGFNYGDGLDAASKILYACKDERLSYDDASREPLIRACGKSEQRSVAMVLSICE
jgi:hypothetical protein